MYNRLGPVRILPNADYRTPLLIGLDLYAIQELCQATLFLLGHSRSLFHYFCHFKSYSRCFHYKILPMTGLESETSGIGSNRSSNRATTTAHNILYFISAIFSLFLTSHPPLYFISCGCSCSCPKIVGTRLMVFCGQTITQMQFTN